MVQATLTKLSHAPIRLVRKLKKKTPLFTPHYPSCLQTKKPTPLSAPFIVHPLLSSLQTKKTPLALAPYSDHVVRKQNGYEQATPYPSISHKLEKLSPPYSHTRYPSI